MLANLRFVFSLVAFLTAVSLALIVTAKDYPFSHKTVMALSTWSISKDNAAELRYLGFVFLGSCRIAGATAEENKKCVTGRR